MFLAKNNKSGSHSKHIDIKYLAIREHVKSNKVAIEHISTGLMISDPLTKGLPPKAYNKHVEHVGLNLFCKVHVIETPFVFYRIFWSI